MENTESINSFKNKEEAKELLKKSRKRIDEIDNKIVELIDERTSLAKDIVAAKKILNMEIYDKSRENEVQEQMYQLAKEHDIDADILNVIMNMLAMLSKNKQKEILKEE